MFSLLLFMVQADIQGTSDPYVTLEIGDIQRQTRTIYRTLNPYFNEVFEM